MSKPGPWGDASAPTPAPRRKIPAGRFAAGAWLALIGACIVAVFALNRAFPGHITTSQDWIGVSGGIATVAVCSVRLFSGALGRKAAPRHLALWAGLVALLVLGYSFRGELTEVWTRVRSEAVPSAPTAAAPGEMVVSRDEDGGFYVMGQVNGQPVRFLVDTGASDVVLSPADARRLGVDLSALAYGKPVETANGPGFGAAWTADSLTVGSAVISPMAMSVNKAPMSSSLLGMAFFNRMKSFRVEGSKLYLRP